MNAHIEKLAREASSSGSADELTGDAIERFAKAIAEDCAKVAETEHLVAPSNSEDDIAYDMAINHAAKAIRERYK